jgi:transcriptional regulator with XRE-family HTH domain
MISLGKFIKHNRQLLKLSQKDLAQKLNLSPSAINTWELEKGAPTKTNLFRLAMTLNGNVNDMYHLYHKYKDNYRAQNLQDNGIVIEMKNSLPYEPMQPDVVQSEPVAWVDRIFIERPDLAAKLEYDDIFSRTEVNNQIPLYTTPQNREWVNLTIEEVKEIKDKLRDMKDVFFDTDILGVIQDKLREKNI